MGHSCYTLGSSNISDLTVTDLTVEGNLVTKGDNTLGDDSSIDSIIINGSLDVNTSKNDPNAINFTTDGGVNEKISMINKQGTQDNSIDIQSTNGGISIEGQNASINIETNGTIVQEYKDNQSYTIKNTTNNVSLVLDDTNNSNETITTTNSTGIGTDAIKLQSTLGGISAISKNASVILKTEGTIIQEYNNNQSYNIKNKANNVSLVLDDTTDNSEFVKVSNTTGTGETAIELNTTSGVLQYLVNMLLQYYKKMVQ